MNVGQFPKFVGEHVRKEPEPSTINPSLEHRYGLVRLKWWLGRRRAWIEMTPDFARALAARLSEMADRAEGDHQSPRNCARSVMGWYYISVKCAQCGGK